MHGWGSSFNYFGDVGAAATYIGQMCRSWGRIDAHDKEKYGTVRVYVMFGCKDLHSLLYPGYAYVRGNYRLMTFPFLAPLRPLVSWWQPFIYRLAYKRALRKWPRIRIEILLCADYPELLEGL